MPGGANWDTVIRESPSTVGMRICLVRVSECLSFPGGSSREAVELER